VNEYSEEFKYWYERIYLQSPSLCKLQYDDEKTWEAWKAGYKLAAKMLYDNYMLSSNKGKEIPIAYMYKRPDGSAKLFFDKQPFNKEETQIKEIPLYNKESKEPQYLYLYEDIGGINITSDKNYATKDMEYVGKIKLEVEDDLEL
jgi:hypothetical protein